MDRLYITATDTDVGKTALTACLAQAARAAGRPVVAAKPVASGVPDGQSGDDADAIAAAAGHAPLVHTALRTPISPHRAAILEGSPVDEAGLRAFVEGLGGAPRLVEGVGGWRSPLALRADGTVLEQADVARWADAAVLLAIPDRLGCLSVARLTAAAIAADGLPLAGVVLVAGASPADDPSTAWNGADLRALLPGVPLVRLPRVDLDDPRARAAAGAAVWAALVQNAAAVPPGSA